VPRHRSELVAVLIASALAAGCRRPRAETSVAATPAPATPSASSAAPASPSTEPRKLVGRWVRGDYNYVIAIDRVAPDGTLEVQYLNPGPIHVSRAEWKSEGGRLGILVELTDRNYPGNFYTLAYDPGSDSLSGIYHHLGLNQTLDVGFSRLEPRPGETEKK
jgi:hypothetical protein